MISAHDVEQAAFRRAEPGRSGYDEVAVDDFLDRAVATLAAVEKHTTLPADALTSKEVVDAVFPEKDENTDGGYDLDDVDDLLDRVAQRLYDDEKKRGDVGPAGDSRDAGVGASLSEGAVADRHETFRDEPAAPELQDDTRSWEEEPRGARDERGDLVDVNPVGGEAVTERPVVESTTERPQTTQPVSSEPEVEQYPATDHRVPLPRGDIRSQLSEEDVRAQNNYHPDYSEYEATSSQESLDRGPDAGVLPGESAESTTDETFRPFDEPAREEQPVTRDEVPSSAATSEPTPVPGEGVRVVAVETVSESAETTEPAASHETAAPAASTEPAERTERTEQVAQDTPSVPEPTAPQGFEGLRPADLSASESSAAVETTPAGEEPAVAQTGTAPATSDAPVAPAAEAEKTSTTETVSAAGTADGAATTGSTDVKSDSAAAGVTRPEGISRPEPIERPRDLPKRDDNSRKGLLRRIFKG